MKFKLKKLNICYWPETQDIWDIVEVKQQKNEDQLSFSNKDYDNFLTSPDTKLKFSDKMTIKDKIENTLSNINSKLEWLMDFWITDRWEVSIEDGQDTQYLKEVSWEINKATNEFLEWQEQAKDNLSVGMDKFISKLSNIKEKATSAENLKWFLNKLEDKKGTESTLNKVAGLFNIWKKLISHRKNLSWSSSEDILAKYEKNNS